MRKSSAARLLTGVGRIETAVEIADVLGCRFHLRSMISAAQEARYTPVKLLQEFNRDARWQGEFNGIRNALVLLRYRAANGCPEGKEYVSAFVGAGWRIACIASLGQRAEDWIRTSGIRYAEFPDSTKMASNEVAHLLRANFGWQ